MDDAFKYSRARQITSFAADLDILATLKAGGMSRATSAIIGHSVGTLVVVCETQHDGQATETLNFLFVGQEIRIAVTKLVAAGTTITGATLLF